MSFAIKPLKELLAMTQEAVDEMLLPLRVRATKAKAESMRVQLETQMINTEKKINELLTAKEVNLDTVLSYMDDYDLLERKLKQLDKLITGLFGESK